MISTKELIQTLKAELHRQNITYAIVGSKLSLSEATIKRMFSVENMSLERLEKICQLIDIDILQLAMIAEEKSRHIHSLTWKYEQEITNNKKLLLLFIYIIYGWQYNDVMAKFDIEPVDGQRLLTRLDAMKVIELLPHNKTRLRISSQFEWIENGPMQAFFEKNMQPDFFQSNFNTKGQMRLVSCGWLSLERTIAFHDKLSHLIKEFQLQVSHDEHIPIDKRHSTTLVVAIRPWLLEMFDEYRKSA